MTKAKAPQIAAEEFATKLEEKKSYENKGLKTLKTSGVSSGSVYTIDGQTFMVKDFSTKDGTIDIKQILQEVIGSKLARLFMQEINPSLIESYPKVNFVENDKKKITSTSSQYIAGFETMLDYMRANPEVRSSTQGTINASEIKEMLDVEFVAALLSHNDLNTRNRGVRKVGEQYYSSIIDFTNCLDSASTNSLNYPEQWLSDDASIGKVINSLGEITTNITADKINALVNQVFANLPKEANQLFLPPNTKEAYKEKLKTNLTEKLTRIKAEKSALEYLKSAKKDLTNAKALLENVKNNLVSTAVMQKLLEKNPDIFNSITITYITNKTETQGKLKGSKITTELTPTQILSNQLPKTAYDKIFLSAIAAKNQDIFNVFIQSKKFTMTFNSLNDAIKASIKSRNELSLTALLNDTPEVLDNNGDPVNKQLLMITKCLELKDLEYLKTILNNSDLAEKDKNKLIVGALYDSITFEDKASFEYLYTTYPKFLVQPTLTAYLSKAMITSNDYAFDKLLSKMSTEFDDVIIQILDPKSTLKDAKKIIYCEKIIEKSTAKDKLITSAFYNSITFGNNVIFDHLLQNHIMSSLTKQNSLPQNQHLYDYLYTAMNTRNDYAFDTLLSKMNTKEEFRGAIEKSIALKKTNYLQKIITKAKSALKPLEFNDLLAGDQKFTNKIIKTFTPNLIESINSTDQKTSDTALQILSDLIKTPDDLTAFNQAIKTVSVANQKGLFKKMMQSNTVANLNLSNAVADNLYPQNEPFIKDTLEKNQYTIAGKIFINALPPELQLYFNSLTETKLSSFNVTNTTDINPSLTYRLPVHTNINNISGP
jgi:hypothetical protein